MLLEQPKEILKKCADAKLASLLLHAKKQGNIINL